MSSGLTTSGPPRPVVRESVEETLNALPEAEANRPCKAQHYALMACSTCRGSDKKSPIGIVMMVGSGSIPEVAVRLMLAGPCYKQHTAVDGLHSFVQS
jgi:hypothetical protein